MSGVLNKVADDACAESSSVEKGMDRHGTYFSQILPQHMETSAGYYDVLSVCGKADDTVVLNILIQIERPSRQHDAAGGEFVDESGDCRHILNLRLAACEDRRNEDARDVGQRMDLGKNGGIDGENGSRGLQGACLKWES